MAKPPSLSESQEDYLEAILEVLSEAQAVRAKTIANRLGVRQPSVTAALHALSAKKLIAYEPYGTIVLTKEGHKIAEKVLARHVFLRRFLIEILGVETSEANEVACKLEHAVSENVMNKLIAFTRFVEEHKKCCLEWDKPKALRKKDPGCADRATRKPKQTKSLTG